MDGRLGQRRCVSWDRARRTVRPRREQHRAKQVCQSCPVRTECLAEALDNQIEWGVWGGTTERERRALLRRRPNVTSWRRLLEAARAEHAGVPQSASQAS
jgi:WhiB family redox-sensing transcriptional regulator